MKADAIIADLVGGTHNFLPVSDAIIKSRIMSREAFRIPFKHTLAFIAIAPPRSVTGALQSSTAYLDECADAAKPPVSIVRNSTKGIGRKHTAGFSQGQQTGEEQSASST